jgi:hypothetical protein
MPRLAWRTDADGFAFVNSWTFDATERQALNAAAQPIVWPAIGTVAPLVVPIDPLFGTIALVAAANAAIALGPLPTYGMCGGMAYASADYWLAKAALPRGAHQNDQPTRGNPTGAALRNMIWQRLLDSLAQGGTLMRTLEWSLVLNQVPWKIGEITIGGGMPGLLARTKPEWDLVKKTIDAGRPCPIGLIYTTRSVWDQHQILAYGYEDPGDGTGKLLVYDSNNPHQFGDTLQNEVTLDFNNPSGLVATSPGDSLGGVLAGFFVTNYQPVVPAPGLATSHGQFLKWANTATNWFVGYGARMGIADTAELTALGGTAADVRSTTMSDPGITTRPRDNALLRERSDARVFLYQGGAPFHVPDPAWLARFGGWQAVRVVPDNTLQQFAGAPDDGTLLREWSDAKVYRIESGTKRWVVSPTELNKWGGFPTVRLVPDGALAVFPDGQPLGPPAPSPGQPPAFVIVPDVVQDFRQQASSAIRAAGLVPRFMGSTGRNTHVVSTVPHAGTMVQAGSTVILRMASGTPL